MRERMHRNRKLRVPENYNEEPNYDEEIELDSIEECSIEDIEIAAEAMHNYKFGASNETISAIRDMDRLEIPINTPNEEIISVQNKLFTPRQINTLEQIRTNNACMAELAGEAFRRIVAGLLEYNTQALGAYTNNSLCDMCEIIDEDKGVIKK